MLTVLLAAAALAVGAPLVQRLARDRAAALLAALTALLFAWFARLVPAIAAGEVLREAYPWVPGLGVQLAFRLDGLALLFALLVTGFGTLVVLYAGRYLAGHPQLGRFFLLLLAFMAAMLGVVLADDLIVLFVFWELTSLTSYLLIGFDHRRAEARASALQALLVTGGGGLALLAGMLLHSAAAGGALTLTALAGTDVRGHLLYPAILTLVLLGAFTKSAQVPFHFWLPRAMAAPTPVSAYLHSATMVKAGIYLLARMEPLLGGTTAWTGTLATVGTTTMLVGAVLALRHTDLKLVLAYSTVSALGTLTLLLGLGFAGGVAAALVFLVVHAFYKGALFLVAGTVDHEAGTRDLLRLGGLRRGMPATAAVALVAGLSMAGVPPLFGFVAKELAYKAALAADGARVLLPLAAVIASALTVAAAGLVALRPFAGVPSRRAPAPHEAPLALWMPPALLAASGLVLGIFPALAAVLVGPAVEAVAGSDAPVKLLLWYGWDLALALSAATLLLGALAYRHADAIRGTLTRLDGVLARGPEAAYHGGLALLLRGAGAQTRLLTRGGIVSALRTIVVASALLVGAAAARHAPVRIPPGWPDARLHEWLLAGVTVLGTLIAVFSRSRMTAVLALGLSGFMIALLYVQLGAPDLAMTQFLVETLVVVIILLVIPQLPKNEAVSPPRARYRRMRDAVVAAAFGGTVVVLLLVAQALPFDTRIPEFFTRESVPGGHGRNIVNVILVDFRALDTLGEITVLLAAGLGAYALLSGGGRRAEPARRGIGTSIILRSATRLLTPLLLLLSLFMLLRGHDEPGGGFIGGLVAAGALALGAIAFGTHVVRRVLVVPPLALAGGALALAALSGVVALAYGADFMVGQWVTVGAGDAATKLGTPLLFDVGVYLLVIGFATRLVLALEESSHG